ncbi:MAG: paraquat-inducible protein A [Pseudomonadota bacterium]
MDIDSRHTIDASRLIGCPKCDKVYKARIPGPGQHASCVRCGTKLISRRNLVGSSILALSIAVFVLVVSATFAPFLSIEAAGLSNKVSLLNVATSFRSGVLILVSVTMVFAILAIPAIRMALLIYVIAPLEFGLPPTRHARTAFRLADRLKPWAMAEVFSIGCAVALVKVSDIAQLEFGAAFWMFVAVSTLMILSDSYMCKWTIWQAIEDSQ